MDNNYKLIKEYVSLREHDSNLSIYKFMKLKGDTVEVKYPNLIYFANTKLKSLDEDLYNIVRECMYLNNSLNYDDYDKDIQDKLNKTKAIMKLFIGGKTIEEACSLESIDLNTFCDYYRYFNTFGNIVKYGMDEFITLNETYKKLTPYKDFITNKIRSSNSNSNSVYERYKNLIRERLEKDTKLSILCKKYLVSRCDLYSYIYRRLALDDLDLYLGYVTKYNCLKSERRDTSLDAVYREIVRIRLRDGTKLSKLLIDKGVKRGRFRSYINTHLPVDDKELFCEYLKLRKSRN